MENKETEENRTAENPAPAAVEIVTAAELIPAEKPKRGRPKGSTVANGAKKPGRDNSGKFTPAESPDQVAIEFVSEIPGEENGGPGPDNENGGPGPGPAANVDYRATAVFIVTMATNSLAGLIGPEWQPDSKTEEEFLVSAVEAYLKTKQTAEIPPGMMLTIALAAYSTKRLQHQNTKTFLGKMKERALKVALWFKLRFSRRSSANLATIQPAP